MTASGLRRTSRRRLVVENDERWPLDSVLELAQPLGLPVVFDAFHHELAPPRAGSTCATSLDCLLEVKDKEQSVLRARALLGEAVGGR